jgi:hypothetical protein
MSAELRPAFRERLLRTVQHALARRRHKLLADLAYRTAAAWDAYVQTDERPRPAEMWTRAATLNEELLLMAKDHRRELASEKET